MFAYVCAPLCSVSRQAEGAARKLSSDNLHVFRPCDGTRRICDVLCRHARDQPAAAAVRQHQRNEALADPCLAHLLSRPALS